LQSTQIYANGNEIYKNEQPSKAIITAKMQMTRKTASIAPKELQFFTILIAAPTKWSMLDFNCALGVLAVQYFPAN